MRNLLTITLLAACIAPVFTQSGQADVTRRYLQRMLQEKMHLNNLEAVKARLLDPQAGYSLQELPSTVPAAYRSDEVVVHDDAKAESEVHAVLNPADTSNLIVAAVLQDPNNFLSPLKVTVYYSNDFGQSGKAAMSPSTPTPMPALPSAGAIPCWPSTKTEKPTCPGWSLHLAPQPHLSN